MSMAEQSTIDTSHVRKKQSNHGFSEIDCRGLVRFSQPLTLFDPHPTTKEPLLIMLSPSAFPSLSQALTVPLN